MFEHASSREAESKHAPLPERSTLEASIRATFGYEDIRHDQLTILADTVVRYWTLSYQDLELFERFLEDPEERGRVAELCRLRARVEPVMELILPYGMLADQLDVAI